MCFGTSSGTLSQLLHFGPLIAMFLIGFITLSGLNCLVQWWPAISVGGQINMTIYLIWPILIYYNYFMAVFLGPGFVPKNWRPENKEDEEKLQFCKVCNSFKAPRSHHCRKCNRCVLKMDHHCPWINTCCGHRNHASFIYFLFFAPLGCVHATIVLSASIYRAIFKSYYLFYNVTEVPIVNLSLAGFICSMFAVGMAIGVIIGVGILFFVQLKIALKNQTGIEEWIVKKANHRRQNLKLDEKFQYPYDLGRKENLRQVFNWNGDFRPIGNGIWWNVADGCDQFTITIEQLLQKEEKRSHSVKYLAIEDYNGSLMPFKYGCKTVCCLPWSEDPRIPLKTDQTIHVTRWEKHWLYGEIEGGSELIDAKKKKGWFPVKCVRLNERLKYVESEEIEAEGDSYRQAQDSIHENDQTSQNEQKLKNKKEN